MMFTMSFLRRSLTGLMFLALSANALNCNCGDGSSVIERRGTDGTKPLEKCDNCGPLEVPQHTFFALACNSETGDPMIHGTRFCSKNCATLGVEFITSIKRVDRLDKVSKNEKTNPELRELFKELSTLQTAQCLVLKRVRESRKRKAEVRLAELSKFLEMNGYADPNARAGWQDTMAIVNAQFEKTQKFLQSQVKALPQPSASEASSKVTCENPTERHAGEHQATDECISSTISVGREDTQLNTVTEGLAKAKGFSNTKGMMGIASGPKGKPKHGSARFSSPSSRRMRRLAAAELGFRR